MAVFTVLYAFTSLLGPRIRLSDPTKDDRTVYEFVLIASFLRTPTRSPRGVHQGAGLDGAGGIRGVQSHYHLSGGVWHRVPVSHFYY